jgi:mono/diheme cytochrome c family protein
MARVVAFVLLLAALVVGAVGCGGSEDASPTPETVVGDVPTEATDTGGGGGGGGEGDAAAGKDVYASAGCGSCHTFADAGSSGTVGPDLDQSSIDFDGAVQQVTNGGGGMPPFSGQLSEQQIADVAAYVTSARS